LQVKILDFVQYVVTIKSASKLLK